METRMQKMRTHTLKGSRILKVTLNMGIGKLLKDPKAVERAREDLGRIAGQKPKIAPAKKSIASFKIREGMPVGFVATLRGKRMEDFLKRLISIALPRTRDFRGISPSAVDRQGNLTIGIREHTVFPEISAEHASDLFGFEVTVTTNAGNRERGLALFKSLSFPIRGE